MEDIRDRIGRVVKEHRRKSNLTQEELAEKLHLSAGFIGQVERGETMPSVDTLCQIINELGIDPRSLFMDKTTGDTDFTEILVLMNQMNKAQRRFLIEFAKLLKSNLQ